MGKKQKFLYEPSDVGLYQMYDASPITLLKGMKPMVRESMEFGLLSDNIQ